MRGLGALLAAVAGFGLLASAARPERGPIPPMTPRIPKVTTLHGRERVDEYAWLREREAPAVRAHLEAENAYAAAVLQPLAPLEAKLLAEMRAAAAVDGDGPRPRLPERFERRRVTAPARDGAKIPVTLFFRRGLQPDGKAPLLLYGFGAYGTSLPSEFCPAYAPERAPLLDRGAIFALAHVRGGGEKDERWHEAGRAATKMTSFTDFIDVAEHLAASGWCARDRMAAMGESAGGLLVAAAVNLRPDLFRAVLALYPFVDVVNTMLDRSLPGTTDELGEWGDPADPEQCASMLRWSPYDNVAPVRYPAIFARGALGDEEVMYWEPAKWVARLRATGAGGRPILLRTALDPRVGHLGPEDPDEHLRDRALEAAFVLRELGVE